MDCFEEECEGLADAVVLNIRLAFPDDLISGDLISGDPEDNPDSDSIFAAKDFRTSSSLSFL